MKINLRQNNAITLIALVITIIVLLILAGITIASLTGDNGLLVRAVSAKENTEQAQVQEELQLAVISSSIDSNGKYNASKAATEITKILLGATASTNATSNTITGTYNGYTYNVDKDGKVTITGNADGSGGDTDLVTLEIASSLSEGESYTIQYDAEIVITLNIKSNTNRNFKRSPQGLFCNVNNKLNNFF